MRAELDTRSYYRLPWTLNDNILGWLEPTKRCNLYCEGCYSDNVAGSDKTLAQVRADMEVFVSKRKVDSISIAGGDPLIHPDIVEIVRMIRQDFGLKPIVNTNGLALTDELLRELKEAGLFGFTFHVDSSQGRPGWKGATELELNALRLEFAERVAAVGGLSVAFNSTVFPHTLKHVPDLMDWASEHIDIVHSMVFILFRTTRSEEFDYFANGRRVEREQLVYWDQDQNPEPLTARDVVGTIRERHPDYEPCAYLGGTVDPQSFKWLVAGRIGDGEQVFGYVGKRYFEAVQTVHHLTTGRYLAYTAPELLSHGRSMMAGFSTFDGRIRQAAGRWFRDRVRSPRKLAKKCYFQSILIIQPIDMMAGGEINMCDGCPDMTVHDGELVWSCRLDEQMKYGCFLTAAPRSGDGGADGAQKRKVARKTAAKKKTTRRKNKPAKA